MADDLTAPGASKLRSLRRRLSSLLLPAATCLVGAVAFVLLIYVLVADDPLGGEPIAVVSLEDAAGESAASDDDGSEPLALRSTVVAENGAGELPPGNADAPSELVIRQPDGAPYASAGLTPSVMLNPALAEPSKHGLLPRKGPDGQRAADAYARPTPFKDANNPRIALVVTGMGLSTTASEAAIDKLPGEVTLAFAPYGREIERLTVRARQDGHELMLQVPLEPYDYPDNDPGPHTLLTGLSDSQNLDRLHWAMSRLSGYVGITNHMGARFTASDRALRPFLGELRERGLIYADAGASARSVAGEVARDIGLPFASGDLVVDAVATRESILRNLKRLEEIALEGGLAVGIASGLPVTVDEIAEWASLLEGKGISLVPITSAVSGGQT